MTTAVHRPRRLLGTACALVAASLIAAPAAFFGGTCSRRARIAARLPLEPAIDCQSGPDPSRRPRRDGSARARRLANLVASALVSRSN
jgi:hypothetical protein